MLRLSRHVLPALLLPLIASVASAQRAVPAGFSASPPGFEASHPAFASAFSTRGQATAQAAAGTPRWLKWGLIGAAGGAVLFSLAGQSNPDGNRSVAGDAALGAAIGFVILGGSIALYDAVCSPTSGSRRAGLCGR